MYRLWPLLCTYLEYVCYVFFDNHDLEAVLKPRKHTRHARHGIKLNVLCIKTRALNSLSSMHSPITDLAANYHALLCYLKLYLTSSEEVERK